jgi:hypothetical protein
VTSLTAWNGSMAMTAWGAWVRTLLANAGPMSMLTASTRPARSAPSSAKNALRVAVSLPALPHTTFLRPWS